MRQTHSTSQTVRPGAERRHGDHRKEGPGPSRSTPRNHARVSGPRMRVVAAPGGVAFVEESATD
jgi:hypothetical protein